jgi:hypothetical protein
MNHKISIMTKLATTYQATNLTYMLCRKLILVDYVSNVTGGMCFGRLTLNANTVLASNP